MRSAVRLDPSAPRPSDDPNRRRYYDSIRGIENQARSLASKLEGGAGREETLPVATRLRKFVRDAEEYGSMFGAPGYVQEKIDPVVSTLDQLAPFYLES